MLNIFTLANGRLYQEEIESLAELAKFKPIWVDLEEPTAEEKDWVRQHYELQIPIDVMSEDIEESARFTKKITVSCMCAPTFWWLTLTTPVHAV